MELEGSLPYSQQSPIPRPGVNFRHAASCGKETDRQTEKQILANMVPKKEAFLFSEFQKYLLQHNSDSINNLRLTVKTTLATFRPPLTPAKHSRNPIDGLVRGLQRPSGEQNTAFLPRIPLQISSPFTFYFSFNEWWGNFYFEGDNFYVRSISQFW
jgi:hypothetical protein